jgi:glycosyltransferase involved in cell wall biosynthesis
VLSPVLDLDFWRAGAVSDLTRRTLRARNGLSNRFVLLAPHRFMPTKGQLDALEALRVLNASGHRFALILAGEISGKEQPYAERLRAYIREHGLSGDVIWLPPQDRIEMREWYAASDAVLVPTTNEALGLVALEAQAMGVPVAGYRAMGIPETVEDGVTGLLSEPGDFAGLAANVARMESDAEFYAQARTRAPRFVREAYDPTAVAAQHEAFYRGLIDRARRR